MVTIADRKESNLTFWGATIVVALWLLAVLIRIPDFRTTTGAENLEASYHVLLTIKALEEQPASETRLLPIVTLGSPLDKHIPWGATIPNAHGNYFYTSFPPLGFLAPYAASTALGVKPTLPLLSAFNCCLGLMSALLLYAVLVRATRLSGHDKRAAAMAALAGSTVIIFSREALHSFGLVYWAQSLNEVFLLAQLLNFLYIWSPEERLAKPSVIQTLGLATLSFLTAYTEWTGYLANGAIATFILVSGKGRRRGWYWFTVVACATVVAIAAICLQYFVLLGTHETLHALSSRLGARSVTNSRSSITELLDSYVRSFGMFLVTAITATVAVIIFRFRHGTPRAKSALPAILVIVAGAMIENIALMQHASQFSFDRLKMSAAIGAVIAFSIANTISASQHWQATAMAFLVAISTTQGYWSFKAQQSEYSSWQSDDQINREMIRLASKSIDLSCATLGTDGGVRGYLNLAFDRGVFERVDVRTLEGIDGSHGTCGYLFIEQSTAFKDLPRFDRIIIRSAGHVEESVIKRPTAT